MERREIVGLVKSEIGRHRLLSGLGAEWWRGVVDYFAFHAPRVGDALMRKLVREFVRDVLVRIGETGSAGDPPRVPERVRRIWAAAERKEGGADGA